MGTRRGKERGYGVEREKGGEGAVKERRIERDEGGRDR